MTDTTTDPTPADTPAPPAEEVDTATTDDTADQDHEAPEDRDEDRGGNREAARRRRELREARAEVDRLTGVLDRMRRSEVERLVGDRLVDAADVWRDGADLAALLDDDGLVDASKVDEVLGTVLEAHPHWAPAAADARRMGATGRGSAPEEVGTGVVGLRQALGHAVGRR
ncbi:hypothetical protein [Kineococcus rhizosphaerae]|uniref:Uncharacterized protein n=1 Tax=Kineococcus rhizosphaerae TaxID=559628 RepID=A0A2T0R251_9ACTN|nr:hypothetical protein [Kineococcus rhizosphaerae]PRY13595.1 hypothetical protein CLV37_108265 [Kineococcus rhizosphaerae]